MSEMQASAATGFRHDNVVPQPGSDAGKTRQVADMFDEIAFRYDFLNRFLSARMDVIWRRRALNILRKAIAAPNPHLLDMATGTADMAIRAAGMFPASQVTGIDISAGMLELGRKKVRNAGLDRRIRLLQGDSEAINFADASFDGVMVAFGVRNFSDLEQGLRELLRVLRPGGALVILEFARPRGILLKGLFGLYMRVIAPAISRIFSSSARAYRYLWNSVDAFPERESLVAVLQRCGYTDTSYQSLTPGICAVYCGKKAS